MPPPPPPAPLVVSFEQKMSWILRLEDERVLRDAAPPSAPVGVRAPGAIALPPPAPVPDLVQLLNDTEARIRRRAALAVGRVGLVEGVPPLLKLLASDADAEVRQMAAFALGLLGRASAAHGAAQDEVNPATGTDARRGVQEALRSISDGLIAALGDSSPLVQGRAAQALGMVGAAAAADPIGRMVASYAETAAAVAPDELGNPLEPAVEAFRLGVYALAELKSYPALAAAVLDGGQPRLSWWPVAYALQRVEDPRAYDALIRLVRTEGTYGRAFAARGLGALKNKAAVSDLLPLVDPGRERPVAVSAIRALAALKATEAVPALIKFASVHQLDPNLRLEAVTALDELKAAAAVELWLDLLADRWPPMRAAALRALAQTDPESFVLVLSSREPDPHWSVRAALAEGLGLIDARVAVPRLMAMRSDEDQRVIPAVLTSLVRHQVPEAAALALEYLKAPDVGVRLRAARVLGDLRPEGGAAALADAYRQATADPTYVARAVALDALAAYGLPAAQETLEVALADKDWAVRVRAASHLARLAPGRDYAQEIRPAPTRLAAADYGNPSLVQPSVSPHLYVETEKGVVQIELAVLDAPITTHSFIALARAGFFNGLSIHRVVPNFVVQGGDPRGDGDGGAGYTLRDELGELPYLRGTVGIALDWMDTGSSQFFITHAPQPHLDGRYTVLGRVIDGMAVVDRLQQWDIIRRIWVWDGTSEPR